MMLLCVVPIFGLNEPIYLYVLISKRSEEPFGFFYRTVLCVLGALLFLGTCLDYTGNHGHREMVPDLNMKNGKIEPDENSPLLDGTSSKDQQPVVVSILDTEGSVTISTIFTLDEVDHVLFTNLYKLGLVFAVKYIFTDIILSKILK